MQGPKEAADGVVGGGHSLHSNRLHIESAKFLARSANQPSNTERNARLQPRKEVFQGPGIKENIFKWKPGCYQHSGIGREGRERMMADPSIGSFSCRSLVRVLPLNSICHQWKTERKSVMGEGARWVCLLYTQYLWPAQQICVSLLLELLLILATMKHLISSSSKTVWV